MIHLAEVRQAHNDCQFKVETEGWARSCQDNPDSS